MKGHTMDAERLEALAKRCEESTNDMQGALIEDAWEALAEHSASFRRFACAPCSGFGTNGGKFSAAMDAHAYESAAMMLVPGDMRDEIEITTLYLVARVTINMNHGPDGCPFYGSNECNSIPLALTAASLRAISQQQRGHNHAG